MSHVDLGDMDMSAKWRNANGERRASACKNYCRMRRANQVPIDSSLGPEEVSLEPEHHHRRA